MRPGRANRRRSPKSAWDSAAGSRRVIGHTQPRRIAARSIAARIAEELRSPLGKAVGYKIRFTDATGDQTYIKLMTDGILLAETQEDRFLDRYDTMILDEAHERSLNIDFLIGYLKNLLPQRRDLKLIVTSATIDAGRFAEHFATKDGPAPVLEVSGRAYPVEVRYRPVEPDEETGDVDVQQAVLDAVHELARIDGGDMLIFMPTERDIHETAKALRSQGLPGDTPQRQTEILPLYARLSAKDQQRVFHPGGNRRIVIATNVAESSLTVPRIRFVIDPGTARISRYSARSKIQRLPVEPVSQASADQRMGAAAGSGRASASGCSARRITWRGSDSRRRKSCGRTWPGSSSRPRPCGWATSNGSRSSIRRGPTPSATVSRRSSNWGRWIENDSLTETGRRMARIPVDPRIGRMILAAADEGCLGEVLVIASALEIQDPRERPLEKQEQADACHAPFADPDSDFLSCLKLWDFFQELRRRSRGTNSTRRAGSTSCRSTGCGSGSTSTGNSCNWWNRRGLLERQTERFASDRGPSASPPRTRTIGRSRRRPRLLLTGRSTTRQFTGRS